MTWNNDLRSYQAELDEDMLLLKSWSEALRKEFGAGNEEFL